MIKINLKKGRTLLDGTRIGAGERLVSAAIAAELRNVAGVSFPGETAATSSPAPGAPHFDFFRCAFGFLANEMAAALEKHIESVAAPPSVPVVTAEPAPVVTAAPAQVVTAAPAPVIATEAPGVGLPVSAAGSSADGGSAEIKGVVAAVVPGELKE